MHKALPLNQSCFSRLLEFIAHAGHGCFVTTARPSCNDTVQRGYIIFQHCGKYHPLSERQRLENLQLSSLGGRCHSQRYGVFQCIQRGSNTVRTPQKCLHEVGHPFPHFYRCTAYTGGSRGTSTTRSFTNGCQTAG